MAQIERDAELVHFRNRLPPQIGKPVGFAIQATDAERRAPIVSKLHDPNAEPAEQLDAIDFVLEHVRRLEGIDDAELLFFLRAVEVGRRADVQEKIGSLFHQLLGGGNIRHGGLEVPDRSAERGFENSYAGFADQLRDLVLV